MRLLWNGEKMLRGNDYNWRGETSLVQDTNDSPTTLHSIEINTHKHTFSEISLPHPKHLIPRRNP